MLLAYDYPLLGLFWTMLWLYLLFAFFMALFMVIGDVLHNEDTGGFAKAIWIVVLILLPGLGILVYLIANGQQMAVRRAAKAKAADDAMRAYVRDAAGTGGGGTAAELSQLAALRDAGSITEAEFESGKAKVLG